MYFASQLKSNYIARPVAILTMEIYECLVITVSSWLASQQVIQESQVSIMTVTWLASYGSFNWLMLHGISYFYETEVIVTS